MIFSAHVIRSVIFAACAAALPGCASLRNAGTADYTVRPFAVDGRVVCCEVHVRNGKEMDSLRAHITRDGDRYTVDLEQSGVRAFDGQAIAAGVVSEAVSSAIRAGVSAIQPVPPTTSP